MGTTKKSTIHRLTSDFVEIDTEQHVEVNGAQVKLDIPKHSTSYANSRSGRERLRVEQPENIIAAVMAIWGDAPTIEDPKAPAPDPVPEDPAEEKLNESQQTRK